MRFLPHFFVCVAQHVRQRECVCTWCMCVCVGKVRCVRSQHNTFTLTLITPS